MFGRLNRLNRSSYINSSVLIGLMGYNGMSNKVQDDRWAVSLI